LHYGNTARAALHLLTGVIVSVLLALAVPALGASFKLGTSWIDQKNCQGGNGDVAIAGCTAVINDAPESAIRARAYFNRGNAWMPKGDNDRAIADYTEAIRLDPKNAELFNNRCWTRAVIGQLEQALEDCETSLNLRPGDGRILDSRALVHLKQNDFKKAIADYDAVLTIDPENAASFYGRGLAKQKMGDTVGGNADIAAATSMDGEVAQRFSSYGIE
jgi:tetratricopeptide (TPR) repeat protein